MASKSIEQYRDEIQKLSKKLGSAVANGASLDSENVTRWANQIGRLENSLSDAVRAHKKHAREQRNHRLIQKGTILEDFQAVSNGLTKAPQAPRASKKDDPEGYQRYVNYKNYTAQKEELSSKITPQESEQWLASLSKQVQKASGIPIDLFVQAIRVNQNNQLVLNWNSEAYRKLVNIFNQYHQSNNQRS